MAETLVDLDRNDLIYNQPIVDNVLPQYFQDQYPQFVSLLDKYYDWLRTYTDSDGRTPIGELEDIAYLKDREITPERFLDFIYDELTVGLSSDNFTQSRFFAKFLPFFYKTRGTAVSAEGFLKFLNGDDIELSYPKDQTFVVGQSELGSESLRFIQDSYYYQIYSILVKSPVPVSEWKDLYKQYIHPAGWEIFSALFIEGIASNVGIVNPMPTAVEEAAPLIVSSLAEFDVQAIGSRSNITAVDATIQKRMYVDGEYNYYTAQEEILYDSPYNQYNDLSEPLDPNSRLFSSTDDQTYLNFNLANSDGTHTMDDSDSAGGSTIFTLDRLNVFKTIDFSNTIETFDEAKFDYYSDS